MNTYFKSVGYIILCFLICSFGIFGCKNNVNTIVLQSTTKDSNTSVFINTEAETIQFTTEEIIIETEVTEEDTEEEVLGNVLLLKDNQLTELIKNQMEKRNYQGDCSVKVYDLTSGICSTFDSHSMQAASLIKLFIAGAVYENLASGTIQQTENMNLLLSKMISESDNTAANDLVSILGNGDTLQGMQRVNNFCKDNEFSDTHMGRLLLDSNDQDDNYTSVADVTTFLMLISTDSLAGAHEILSYMKAQERTSKLPAGIPDGITTANKTGELTDVENDAMIVLTADKPYIICVMCQNLNNSAEARSWMIQFSSKVYEYFTQKTTVEN